MRQKSDLGEARLRRDGLKMGSSRLLRRASKGLRRHTGDFMEHAAEVGPIFEPHLAGDAANVDSRILKQEFGLQDTVAVEDAAQGTLNIPHKLPVRAGTRLLSGLAITFVRAHTPRGGRIPPHQPSCGGWTLFTTPILCSYYAFI